MDSRGDEEPHAPKDTAVRQKYHNPAPQVKLQAILNPYSLRNFNAFLQGIIFIRFRQKTLKSQKSQKRFAFYSLLRVYRSVFSDEHFTAVSCRATSGCGQWGCQLQSFPVLTATASLCTTVWYTAPAWGETHHKRSIKADWGVQKFNTGAFCSIQLPKYTWANPAISSWGFHTRFLL